MSAEYDDFEESLLREARRRSSPAGAKARAVAALLAASASASLVVAIGRHLVTLKVWAKSGAGLSTAVAMIGGSAIIAAMVSGSASAERGRLAEAPHESPAASSFAAPPEPTTARSLVEPTSNTEALRVDNLPAVPTTAPSAPSTRPRSAPARPAAPMAPALDVPTKAASESSVSAGGLGQLGRENALIQTAQSALRRGDTQSAFEALDQHGRHFGASGALASEAEVLRIEALARTGRRAEAEARARLLITSDPRSSLVRRVRVILGRDGDSR
ncbi:MAG: hypothetical protein K0S65_6261 [Labilithrix sp.]|nr:hypothetical protein [Labilithrix sp.]